MKPRGKIVIEVALWALISFVNLPILFAEREVIAPALKARIESAAEEEEIAVIARLKPAVDLNKYKWLRRISRGQRRKYSAGLLRELKDNADKEQKGMMIFLKKRKAVFVRQLWVSNSLAFKATKRAIAELSLNPKVIKIGLDSLVSIPQPVLVGQAAAVNWNLTAIGAAEFWNSGYSGEQIVVATIDSGVDINHNQLSEKWRGGDNSWYDPNSQHSTPYDATGHGTQVMGILTAVAPQAKWIAAKAFNDAGEASYSSLELSFQWILDPDGDPDTLDMPDVVNNSWSLLGTTDRCLPELDGYFELLELAGIANVFAAGNDGPNLNTSVSPANCAPAFATGASDSNNLVAYFSSRGPSACDATIYPEVVAPGVNIRTTDLTLGGAFPDAYTYVSGTSFAAPHSAGAMALLLSSLPDTPVNELEFVLKKTAFDLGANGPDNDYGYGFISVFDALNRLLDPVPIKAAYLDDNPAGDLVVDFGQYGIWIYYNATAWVRLHGLNPEFLATGDLDDNGFDEIIIDFGSSHGLWVYYNNSSWVKLHNLSPEAALFADLDNNAGEDLVVDFGPKYGVWVYYNNSIWQKLHDLSPESMLAANIDSDARQELVFDYGRQGAWIYYNNSNWLLLHNLSPEIIKGGYLDANSREDLVFDFGIYGIWIYYNDSSWEQLHGLNAEFIASADTDNNGRDELVIDFGPPQGIWIYAVDSAWSRLHSLSPEFVLSQDIDADGTKEIIAGFGVPYGIWVYYSDGTWIQLHNECP